MKNQIFYECPAEMKIMLPINTLVVYKKAITTNPTGIMPCVLPLPFQKQIFSSRTPAHNLYPGKCIF